MNGFTTMEQINRHMRGIAEGAWAAAGELNVLADPMEALVQAALEAIGAIAQAIEFLTSTP